MIDLDPKIIDQDKIRLTKRKQYFKIAVAPLIIVLLVGLFFSRTLVFTIFYSLSYSNDDSGSAAFISSAQTFLNFPDPYIAHYDKGIALFGDQKYVDSQKSFENALEASPPDDKLCDIYGNLSLTYEYRADMAVKDHKYEEAISLYNQAETTLYNNDCAGKNAESKSKDKKSKEAKERIEKKRAEATKEQNSTGNSENPEGQNPNSEAGLTQEQINNALDNNINGSIYDSVHTPSYNYSLPYVK